jgi:ABC-type branched-subunit amino acid transport system substrate-binding protein
VKPRNTRTAGCCATLLLCIAAVVAACSPTVVPPPEPPVMVRRGDRAFHYKDYDTAIKYYQGYIGETAEGPYMARTYYKCALASYRLGRYQNCLMTLDDLDRRYPDDRWVQVEALRGDAEYARGHEMRALQAWDAAWAIGRDSDREKLRHRILVVARTLDGAQLKQAQQLVETRGVQRLLDHQLAKREAPASVPSARQEEREPEELAYAPAPMQATPAEHSGQYVQGASAATEATQTTTRPEPAKPQAASAATEATQTTTRPEPAKPRRELADVEMEPWPVDELRPRRRETTTAPPSEETIRGPATIGCLLPLSGRSRNRGELTLSGIRLALGEQGPPLVVKDTGSNSAVALSAFEDLSRDPSVLAVIGQLTGDQAEAIAPEAERSHMPLFVLSQRDHVQGPSVLQLGVTQSEAVETLLEYATAKARLRRFGVLYPDDASGRAYVSAFRAAAERRGGRVVGAAAYRPGVLHPGSVADTLRKWRANDDLQAVFLPDAVMPAAQLAWFLQNEMPDVTLLGVTGWEGLADQDSGEMLSGVLFTDGFYASSMRPATREFVERFAAAHGQPPGIVEAQAYDAALLAKRALDAGARSRPDVLRRLAAADALQGATGEWRLTPTGLRRTLFLLQVYNGKLQEVTTGEG